MARHSGIASIFSVILGISGVAVPQVVGPNRAAPSAVPAPFKFLYEAGIPSGQLQTVWAALPYESITLERSNCMIPCPAYKVRLYREALQAARAGRLTKTASDVPSSMPLCQHGASTNTRGCSQRKAGTSWAQSISGPTGDCAIYSPRRNSLICRIDMRLTGPMHGRSP
jgi:hypothetical protein